MKENTVMTLKLLTAAAALAIVLPVSAHAEQGMRDSQQSQQREIERSRFEAERSAVRDRLDQRDSVVESTNPSTLNRTSPSSGTGTSSGTSASGTAQGSSAAGTAPTRSATGTPSGASASGTSQGSSASGTASTGRSTSGSAGGASSSGGGSSQ